MQAFLVWLFGYGLLRSALADLIDREVPVIWQALPFLCCLFAKLLLFSPFEVAGNLLTALLGSLPFYLLWRFGVWGGADVKQGFLYNFWLGALAAWCTLFLACLLLLAHTAFNILIKKIKNMPRDLTPKMPLLPAWLLALPLYPLLLARVMAGG